MEGKETGKEREERKKREGSRGESRKRETKRARGVTETLSTVGRGCGTTLMVVEFAGEDCSPQKCRTDSA
ncbi:hypothetical protein RHGRI_030786 [Rhododendron griersonianum]|uniref:Uncharacterized protein n=1 Tax=Rhododendron griersonianum TaxID=479676 RepID=A0AAV6I5B4_9ERIC|nr:hypothetical protein RHGRI_030786 [Rhododendron griersonianum]